MIMTSPVRTVLVPLLAVLSFVAAVHTSSAATPSFTQAQTIDMSGSGGGLIASDLDGDGDVDMVAALDDTINFFPTASEVFGTSFSQAMLGNVSDLEYARVVGDGRRDVMLVGANTDFIEFIEHNDLGFGPTSSLALTNARKIAAGRFNNDSLDDILVGRTSGDGITVRLNNGDGTFTSAAVSQTAYAGIYADVATADLNRDGYSDLIATDSQGGSSLRVNIANGSGGFGSETKYNLATQPFAPVSGDVTGDGFPDVMIMNASTSNIQLFKNLGTGSGGLAAPETITVCSSAQRARVVELNGDAFRDIVVACFGESSMRVLYGQPGGTFASTGAFTSATGATHVAVADVNRDDRDDVIVQGYGSGDIIYHRNTTVFPKPGVGAPTARKIRSTRFTARAAVTPRFQVTRIRVRYGLVGKPMNRYTTAMVISRSSTARTVSIVVRGLKPGRAYRYRVVASAAAGTTSGAIRTMRTKP